MLFYEVSGIKREPSGVFHRYADRAAWESADAQIREFFLQKGAEAAQNIAKWQPIPHSLYCEFAQNGNRSNYENVYFKRRYDFIDTVICECLEGRGRYFKTIADGLSALCDEISWCLPAHNPELTCDGIGDESNHTVDLFAADTGALIAVTLWLLGDELQSVCPAVAERAERELRLRVTQPYLNKDYGWTGSDKTQKLSNWSTWISANMLLVTLLTYDESTALLGMNKAVNTLNAYYDSMPNDGECDEGVAYWNVAAAALFNAVEILNCVSTGKVAEITDKLRSAAQFAYRMHIADGKFANYGDCSPSPWLDYPTAFRFALFTKSDGAAHFAAERYFKSGFNYYYNCEGRSTEMTVFRALSAVFCTRQMREYALAERESGTASAFYARSKILVYRTEELFFSAKGGGCDGGHSHRDAGSFILYRRGLPVAADVGTQRYTKANFGAERDSLWYIRSAYHNLPVINGAECSCNVSSAKLLGLSHSCDGCFMSLDMTEFYLGADINSYIREFTVSGESISVRDVIEFKKEGGCALFNIICAAPPQIGQNSVTVNGCRITLAANAEFSVAAEQIPFTDAALRNSWNELYKLTTAFYNAPLKLELQTEFT